MNATILCERKQGWTHRSDGGFDRDRYAVDVLGQPECKAFVEAEHYAGSFPNDKWRYGLFDRERDDELVGALVFSVPGGSEKVLTCVFPHLEPYKESIELGRLVLRDEVPSNAESHFVAESARLVAENGVRGILSCSDPVTRYNEDGEEVKKGHFGCTYQAWNMLPIGRTSPRTHWVLPDGTLFSPVAAQKVRQQKSGHEYAERLLARWGARPMRAGENPAAWLREQLPAACRGRTFRHPGNLRYAAVAGLTKKQRRSVVIKPEPDPAYAKANVIVDGPRPLELAA